MNILDLEMEQRSSKMDTLKEQLQKMEEEQYKTEQECQRKLRIQKQNIQTDSTIQDLEDMIHSDLSYNIPITYIDDTNGRVRTSPSGIYALSQDHKIIKTTLFDYKKDFFRKNIVNYNKFKKREIGRNQFPHYPIQTLNGEPYIEGPGQHEPIIRFPTADIFAETSDKFVAILNIVKQQDERIKDLEMRLKQDCM